MQCIHCLWECTEITSLFQTTMRGYFQYVSLLWSNQTTLNDVWIFLDDLFISWTLWATEGSKIIFHSFRNALIVWCRSHAVKFDLGYLALVLVLAHIRTFGFYCRHFILVRILFPFYPLSVSMVSIVCMRFCPFCCLNSK